MEERALGVGFEGLALTRRLFPLPSDASHQQRGVPGFQCEPGAGISLRVGLGGDSMTRGSRPEPAVLLPLLGVHRAGAQSWEATASTSPGHLPEPHPRPKVPS